MKKCLDCGKTLNVFEFSKHKATRDGLQRICKVCDRARSAAYYQKNIKKCRAQRLKWQDDHRELHNLHAYNYQKRKKVRKQS